MPLFKRCDKCGKKNKIGSLCSCSKNRYKEECKYVDDEIKQFYWSIQWVKIKDTAKEQLAGLDLYSLYVLKTIEYGAIMHHIEPIKDDFERRLDLSNLIFLTDSNHQIIHKIMDSSPGECENIKTLLYSLLQRFTKGYE